MPYGFSLHLRMLPTLDSAVCTLLTAKPRDAAVISGVAWRTTCALVGSADAMFNTCLAGASIHHPDGYTHDRSARAEARPWRRGATLADVCANGAKLVGHSVAAESTAYCNDQLQGRAADMYRP